MLQSRGIVFRTVKYGESSVIADIFTEEKGLLTFIAGSVRSAKSRMPFGLFQPMTVLDTVSYYKPTPGAMHRLREARIAEVFAAIPFDVRRGGIALFMAEVCRKCLREAETHPEAFAFLLEYLLHLDRTNKTLVHFPTHFLTHFSAQLGFQIASPVSLMGDAKRFSPKEGLFVRAFDDPDAASEPVSVYLVELLQTPLDHTDTLQADRPLRKAALAVLLRYYQHHVPDFGVMRTPEVLEMLWK